MYKKQSWKIMKAVLKSLKGGASINAACQGAGISTPTLWAWRRKDDRLDVLVKTIYESRVQIVEDALFKGALEGNTTAQIFFLKNRQPNRWRDVYDHKGHGMGATVNVHPNKIFVFQDAKIDDNDRETETEDLYAGEGAECSRIEGKV